MRNPPILLIIFCISIVFVFTKKISSQSKVKINNLHRLNTLNLDWDILRYGKENGIDFSVNFSNDFFYDISGGINTGAAYTGLFNPKLNLDFGKIVGWKGTTMHISINGTLGNNFNREVGTEQGVDNIDAFDTWKIYEFWIQQQLINKHLSFKFGLYDLNSEFDVRLSSLVFLNPSQAIGPEFSLTGKNGPSIFPTTSLAFRIKYNDDSGFYIQSAILDGVPGDPNNPSGTHIILNSNDGFLLSGEAGFVKEEDNLSKGYEKFFIGGWYYTSKFRKLLTTAILKYPVYQEGNYGIYFSGEKFLWGEAKNYSEGLTAFFRIGISSKYVNTVDGYLGLGIQYTGLIPGRNTDVLGIALASAHNSSKYIALLKRENINIDKYESTIELTYLYYITDWFSLQPDIQYIINPVHSYKNDYAFITGIRLLLDL